MRPVSMRSPSSDSSAGSSVTAVATANSTTSDVAEPDGGEEADTGQRESGHRDDDGAAGEEDGRAGRAHGGGEGLALGCPAARFSR